jgi:hypothetical protein
LPNFYFKNDFLRWDLIRTGKDALMPRPRDFQAFIIGMAFQYAQITWYFDTDTPGLKPSGWDLSQAD